MVLRLALPIAMLLSAVGMALVTAKPAHASGDPSLPGVNVYVGYADDLRASPVFPVPWVGDTATTCVGCTGSPFDAGAIRLDNVTSSPITVNDVAVDVHGNPFNPFDLWGSFTIPPLSTKILTQTAQFNFDTSDFPIEPCGTPADPSNQPPTVTITLAGGGGPVTFTDSGHILDTHGYDLACVGNESLPWNVVGTPACTSIGLQLAPATQTRFVGTQADVVATLSACSSALPNTTVQFSVTSGPNAGATGSGVTDSNGQAHFMYSSATTGTDTVVASVTNITGGGITSNTVTVNWIIPYLASGAFVVGDLSAAPGVGTGVTFWGAQWWKDNSLSGGAAPAAFKGFEDSLTNPTCGASWTTDPGNSTPPPASVPSFMAVIVSSGISQSGSTISGNIAHIVIVQTNPGYAGNPGHAGTGTIIAQVC